MFVWIPFRLLVVILAGTLGLAIPALGEWGLEPYIHAGETVRVDSKKFQPPELPVSLLNVLVVLD